MDPCPILVGRQQELAALRAVLDAGGGVAIVSGEAGIGKSRLVREFANEAVARGRLDLWARPEEVAQPGPYALIVDLLESIVERGGGSLKTEARALIAELTRSDGDASRPPPSPRTVAAEIRGLVSQLRTSPLVVMEDLHWADEQSHSVILHLMRAARDDQHVVIATMRPERGKSEESLARLIDSVARERTALELPLPPLQSDQAAQMLELIWHRPPTEQELHDIDRLGEGVPFFIEELSSSSVEVGKAGLPKNIEQSVAARVSELGQEASRILRAASLTTGALDVAVLGLACDVSHDRVAEHLTRAVRAGLLVDKEARVTFRHTLARQALAESLVSVEVAQTHARLAAAIEKVHAEELDSFAAALAGHFLAAGEKQSAIEYAVRAGERALAFAALEEARASFRLALQLDGSTSGAKRGLAEVEFREGNEREAAVLFRQVADELKGTGEFIHAARVLGRLAWALQETAAADAVVAVLDEGLDLLKLEDAPNESARLVVQKGSVICFLEKDPARARPILTQALDEAETTGDALLMAEALDALAQVADQEGRVLEALEVGVSAIETSRRAQSPEAVGRSCHNHAVRLAAYGRSEEALEVLAEGRRHLEKAHGRAAVGALDVSEGWVAWLMGLPERVAHLTARGRYAWQRWRGYRWLLETWASVERGEHHVAEAVIAGAWEELGGPPTIGDAVASVGGGLEQDSAFAIFAYAYLLFEQTDAADELERVTAHLLKFEDVVERFDFGQMLALRARALIKLGRWEAPTTLAPLMELAETYHYPYLKALVLECRAELSLAQGKAGDACEGFEEAARVHESIANGSDRVRCLRRLATAVIAQSGDSRDKIAVQHLRLAWDLARSIGAIAEAGRVEFELRSAGVRPRAGRPRKQVDQGALSPREAEVAALVAAGETNAGIAGRLFLSDRTVQDHIGHALRKLGLPGRAALASWAVREGMV